MYPPTPAARKSAGKKEAKDEVSAKDEADDDSDSESQGGNDRDADDVDVRDVRYRLENLDIENTYHNFTYFLPCFLKPNGS